MIATSVAYDLVFVLHLLAALSSVVVLVTLRVESHAATTTPRDTLKIRFRDRPDWAARVVHLLPVTGVVMVATGGSSVALSQPWVQTGIVIYVVLAWWLEARTLTFEREFARVVHANDEIPSEMAIVLTRRVDVALALVGLALITMLVHF